jgi:hypothetical protein
MSLCAGGMYGGCEVALAGGEPGERRGNLSQRPGVPHVAGGGLVILEPAG